MSDAFDEPKPRPARSWPGVSLRTYLVAAILLATLPIAAVMLVQILRDLRQEQAAVETALVRSTASLAQLLESEFTGSFDALGALARADQVQLLRHLQSRPRPRRSWDSLFLMDRSGAIVFDTAAVPAPAPAPVLDLHRRIVERAQPAATGLVDDPTPHVVLAVPAGANGAAGSVLGARVGLAVWQRLAQAATLPPGAIVTLHGPDLRTVSAGRDGVAAAPAPLVTATIEAMREQPAAVQRLDDGDGEPLYTAWRLLPATGWSVRVALPVAPIAAAHRQSIIAALSTTGASLLLGVVLAALAARQVTRPLHRLAVHGPGRLADPGPVREIGLLRDALLAASHQDQAARVRPEAKAQEFETLFNSSPVAMALAQEAGHVGFFHYRFAADQMAWTPGQFRLFGIDRLGQGRLDDWLGLIDATDRARVRRELDAACAQGREKETFDYGVVRPDGSARWFSSRVMLHYDGQGRPEQMTGVTVDLSDAMAARVEAEAASRAKDEFITMLSHELRNPLGAIAAAVDVLEGAQPQGETAAEARAIIARQTRNLSHMMNDLLDVSRVIAGKILLSRQPVDLADIARRVEQTLALTGAAANHRLHCTLQPAWVDGDAVRLEQILGNLLTNALKYTPAGGDIGLSVRRDGDTALIEVQDCGEGIPGALLPHIFDLFVQGERALDRRAGGLGIGLTLVRRLVELHGGTVSVETSPAGSRFTVRLPAVDGVPAPVADALPLPRRRQVLVVEDNQDVLAALRSKLELDGHTVSTATDGLEGLDRLLQLRPEVAVVDIGLPAMTGFELARHARAAGYAGRMIAISGYGHERDRVSAMAAGFDAYLVKPVDRMQLRASLSD